MLDDQAQEEGIQNERRGDLHCLVLDRFSTKLHVTFQLWMMENHGKLPYSYLLSASSTLCYKSSRCTEIRKWEDLSKWTLPSSKLCYKNSPIDSQNISLLLWMFTDFSIHLKLFVIYGTPQIGVQDEGTRFLLQCVAQVSVWSAGCEVLKEVLIYEAKWTYLQNRQIFKNKPISTCDNQAGKFITLQLKPQTLILTNQLLICQATDILCKITHTDIANRSKTDGIEMINNSGSCSVNIFYRTSSWRRLT